MKVMRMRHAGVKIGRILFRGGGDRPGHLDVRRWVAAGILVVLLVFVAGGVWATVTRIAGAVIAQATVSPESGIKTVQHPDGGIVKRILVRSGDRVKAGQVLIVFDEEEIRARLAITEMRLHAGLAEIARLEAERDGAAAPSFSRRLRERKDDPEVQRVMKVQKALFTARRRMLANQRSILEKKVAALAKRITGLEAELAGKERQARLIDEEIDTVAGLFSRGQALKSRLLALQRRAAALEGERGRLLGEIAQARESIFEIRLQVLRLERDFLTRVLDRLAELHETVGILEEQRTDLRRKLDMVRIRAPVDGRVLDVAVKTIGGVVSPRQPILRIVPENEPLILEARVQPSDIDQVEAAQDARIVFTAFSNRDTPVLEGKVRVVSPAPIVDDISKRTFYRAEIVVSAEELRKLPEDRKLIPGMTAEVFLTTHERTPLDMLLGPLIDAARHSLRSG